MSRVNQPEPSEVQYNVFDKCLLCDNNKFENFGKSGTGCDSHPQVVRCTQCKLLFTNPIRTQSSLNTMYDTFGNEYVTTKKLNQKKIKAEAKRYYDKLKLTSSAPRFLNIGSGDGAINDIYTSAGFISYGIEPTKSLYELSLKKNSIDNIRNLTVEEAEFEANSFDLIHFWHVIEHLKDPFLVLNKIFYWLKPGGILNVGTPNASILDNYIGKFSKNYSIGYYHTFIFSKNNLDIALKKAGFDVTYHTIYPSSGVKRFGKTLGSKIKYIIYKVYPKIVSNMQKVHATKR